MKIKSQKYLTRIIKKKHKKKQFKHLTINLINLTEQFTDELSCKFKFKAMHEKLEVTCLHCGSKDHY